MGVTTCGRCRTAKIDEEFSPSYRGKNGSWCRACFAAHKRGEPVTAAPIAAQECIQCGSRFIPSTLRRVRMYCSKECNEAYRVASGRSRESYLARKYGITPDEYDRMLNSQGGGCALCGRRPEDQNRYSTYLHVDHDHATGQVRGLLCDQHNLLLGRWDDDPILLRKAADYIEAGRG